MMATDKADYYQTEEDIDPDRLEDPSSPSRSVFGKNGSGNKSNPEPIEENDLEADLPNVEKEGVNARTMRTASALNGFFLICTDMLGPSQGTYLFTFTSVRVFRFY